MYKICEINQCERQAVSQGLCSLHLRRWKRGKRGAELEAPSQYHDRSLPSQCLVDGCERIAKARGLCHPHYKRWLRGTLGESIATPIRTDRESNECEVVGCDRPIFAKNVCSAHYQRLVGKTNKDMDDPITIRGQKNLKCKMQGCNNRVGIRGAYGLCANHYKRWARKEIWETIIALKGGKCQRCQNVYPYHVYDLHHRDPSQKKYSIGGSMGGRNRDEILKEVEKCDLLCANCHRLEHFGDGSDLHGVLPGWNKIS